MQAHTVSFPDLFSQPVVILAVVLLFIEAISWMLLGDSIKKLPKRIKKLARIGRWDVASILLWPTLTALALSDLYNTSPVYFAFLGTGIALFLLGWWMRYRHACLRQIRNRVKKLRPRLARIESKSSVVTIRYPKRLGAWLEILGLAICAMSPMAFAFSLFIFPSVLLMAISEEERRTDEERRKWLRSYTPKALIPGTWDILRLVSIPVAIGFLIAVFAREFIVFKGDIESARSILMMLTQIEGTLGVLAITIIFVLAQLTGASFSTRTSGILIRQRDFWMSLVILLLSLTYNILVIARMDVFFPSGGIYERLLVDLGLIFGALTVFGIAYFIWRSPKLVSPEAIIADALRHLDGKWMDIIRNDWRRPVMQIRLRVGQDPLVVVDGVLAKSVESYDYLSFTSGLVLLRDRFLEVATPNDMIELDVYLHYHLRSVVKSAAKHSDAYLLEQLVQFVRELGTPSPEALRSTRTTRWDAPAGEMLVREVISEALTERMQEPVRLGLVVVGEGAENVLKTLPSGDETWMFNPKFREIRLSDNKDFTNNDLRVEAFEDQYIRYLRTLGESAIELGLREVAWTTSHRLAMIMLQIQEHAKGLRLKQMLLQQCSFSLAQISDAACKAKMARAVDLGMLQYVAEKVDKQEEEGTAWLLAHLIESTFLEQAKAGILDLGTVVDVAMLGFDLVTKFPEPAVRLIAVMGEAAKHVKSLPDFDKDRELQSIYEELKSRIRQQTTVSSDDRQKIRMAVNSALEALGELEFEERKNQ